MKLIVFLFFVIMTIPAFAQSDFDRSIDKENESVVFKGQCSFDDLKNESGFDWFINDHYQPDSLTVDFLKKNLKSYELVVFLGTWCEDSQNLIPKLYRTLTLAGFDLKQVSMYGVDRAKTAKYVEHQLYHISLVPTIILIKNHLETGRIIESVKNSIEKDLAGIIKKDLETKE